MLEVMINGEKYVKEGVNSISNSSILTASERTIMELLMRIPKIAAKIEGDEKKFLRVLGEETLEGKKIFAEKLYNIINIELNTFHFNILKERYKNGMMHEMISIGLEITKKEYFKGIFMEIPKKGDTFDLSKVCIAGSGTYGIQFPNVVDIVIFPGVEGTRKCTLCV